MKNEMRGMDPYSAYEKENKRYRQEVRDRNEKQAVQRQRRNRNSHVYGGGGMIIPNARQVAMLKETYPEGTKIILNHMVDDPHPVAPGTKGVVENVDDAGTIHCLFNDGRRLGIIPEKDDFRKLTTEEIASDDYWQHRL